MYAGTGNTATGTGTLQANTTGSNNTGDGYEALYTNTTGGNSTATGFAALFNNTTGGNNTATGFAALFNNTSGGNNTATGYEALYNNTTGVYNTATGYQALGLSATSSYNTGEGYSALFNNTTGGNNTATGFAALFNNTSGGNNTATGYEALYNNTTGGNNISYGYEAGMNATGTGNVFLGYEAGINLTTGNSNIEIGTLGVAGDAYTTRIGTTSQTQAFIGGIYGASESSGVAVYINSSGQLGTLASSNRFKTDIRDMNEDSSALYSLRPVSFHYKPQIDPKGTAQCGLIAEEVEKVDPALVAHDPDGKPYSVRYEQVNAMLLNEFLKEHARTQAQTAAIAKLEAANAEQVKTLAEAQKEFKAQVRRVESGIKGAGLTHPDDERAAGSQRPRSYFSR